MKSLFSLMLIVLSFGGKAYGEEGNSNSVGNIIFDSTKCIVGDPTLTLVQFTYHWEGPATAKTSGKFRTMSKVTGPIGGETVVRSEEAGTSVTHKHFKPGVIHDTKAAPIEVEIDVQNEDGSKIGVARQLVDEERCGDGR